MIKFVSNLWLKLRVYWSNFRNKNNLKDCEVKEHFYTPYALSTFVGRIYSNFEYTYDGITDLFDSMKFPAECYHRISTSIFKDDCDGFHAAVYHMAAKNDFQTCLLTYVTSDIISSHTVTLIKYLNKYWIIDYNQLLSANTLEQVLKQVLDRRKSKLLCYNLVKYNYSTFKYEIMKEEI